VLAGVRSTSAENAVKGLGLVRFLEPVELYTVYATNQASDMHYLRAKISELRPFINAVVEAVVSSVPQKTPGGHVFFEIRDESGSVTCAAYFPTGRLRNVVSALRPGDEVVVMGAVKQKPQGLTVNIEKIEVKHIAPEYVTRPPKCPTCGRRTESMGHGKGYRCRRCRLKLPPQATEKTAVLREITPGLYEAAVSARRHLTKPINLSTPRA
ncbi:MAG: exodeoxyribonuclease VII large subunit, partial [Candidatus Caldarchaeum sp.]|nr:exodeoxyribonuclease VII large subunit [Candidatus Caldarchaeum sp.]